MDKCGSGQRRQFMFGTITNGNKLILPKQISSNESFVFDRYAVSNMPKEKIIFTKKWNWGPKGDESYLSLGKMTIMDQLSNLRWKLGSITESELHIIYLPHLPLNNYRKYNLSISLNFDGATNDEDRLLSRVEFPVSLHMHVIFYPGHSFSLKRGNTYPWSLHMTTDAPIDINYLIADAYVQLKAYNAPTSLYTEKRGANLISLVPLSEVPTGIVMTRPRDKPWKIGGLQYGLKQERDIKILQRLQTAGIDIEALQNLQMLEKIINKIGTKMSSLSEMEEEKANKLICLEVIQTLKA